MNWKDILKARRRSKRVPKDSLGPFKLPSEAELRSEMLATARRKNQPPTEPTKPTNQVEDPDIEPDYQTAMDRKIDASFPISESLWGSDMDDEKQYPTHDDVDEEELCVIYAKALYDNPDGMFNQYTDEGAECTNRGLKEWIGFIEEPTWNEGDSLEDKYHTVSSCSHHKNKVNTLYDVVKWKRSQ